ncbi:MAG: hypothetical protein JXB85_09295 [Anaerolineales bacterium]|nr:hypothetical protein [Anaerolineales bacterium]
MEINNSTDVWSFQKTLTRRLVGWAGISTALGLAMLLFKAQLWNGIAFQFVGWALVNWAIALLGGWSTRRRRAGLTPEQAASRGPQEAGKLRRILWVNTGLDVVYMLAGLVVAVLLSENHPLWLGTGIGIILQGAFLFGFDWIHAVQVQKFM